ncbi:MAG: cytochrome c3 family protein [Gammaproteobacteria bacterium]
MSRHRFSLSGLLLGFLIILPMVAFTSVPARADATYSEYLRFEPEKTFPTSLHGRRFGHLTLYSKHLGGLETLTNIPVEELGCLQCHHGSGLRADGTAIDTASYQPSCADCHDSTQGDPGPVNDPDICLECHRRQAGELLAQLPDVHREAGFTCTSCHTKREMHGDGNVYSSLLAPGAKGVQCEDCHLDADNPAPSPSFANPYHEIHAKRVDCSACHAQTMLVCSNCHVPGSGQPIGIHQGFKMLVQGTRDKKVHAAAYMSITTEDDKTFYSIVPRHTHSIVRNGVSSCGDCHFNAVVQQYLAGGKITVLSSDPDGKPIFGQGIMPIPEDWQSALQFAFWKNDNGAWQFLKNETDQARMMFAMPLSAHQMEALTHKIGE